MADELTDDADRAADRTTETAADKLDGKDGKDGKKPGGKKPDRKQMIIVVASVLGVIIAYLTYRSRSSSASSAASGSGTQMPLADSAGLGSGTVAGYSGGGTTDLSSALQQLINGQASLSTQLDAQASGTQSTKPSTPVTVKQMFKLGSVADLARQGIHFITDNVHHVTYEVEPTAGGGVVYHALSNAEGAAIRNASGGIKHVPSTGYTPSKNTPSLPGSFTYTPTS